MRVFARLLLVLLALTVTAGPLLAAPVSLHASPVASAPNRADRTIGQVLGALGGGLAVFGAIRIKDAGSLAKKFVQRAGAAAGDYKEGVTQAGGDWETNTKASEDNYAAGVTAAIGDKRFGRGVSAAGAGKYTQRASTLGAQRYPSGVQAAEGAWAQGTQPYLQALSAMSLPPRRPKGDPGNMARSQAVAAQLRALRVGK